MDSERKKLTRICLTTNAGQCLVRSVAEQRKELDRILFRRYPEEEWGTFFRFGYRVTSWGVVGCFVDLLAPEDGDFDARSPLVEFSPGYIGRALRSFDQHPFGIGFIHSHPEGCRPSPSYADDDMDVYFAAEFEKFSGGRPYISLISSRDAEGRRSFSGRCFFRGGWLPVGEWLTCGKDILRRERDFRSGKPVIASETGERVRQLLGEAANRRLQNGVIGIVGCSGLGSPAGHLFARAGAGEFVLVDTSCFKRSNHERNHASRASDLDVTGLPKVELLRRLILEIKPDARVTTIVGDVLENQSLDELTRCDLVLGCTDSYYARAALGDIATHFALPVLDLAVQMSASDGILTTQVGEIARYFPGQPCPWCRNRVTADAIRAEMASDEEREQAVTAALAAAERGEDGAQYWIGLRHQELTVGYMTTLVAAMGVGYAHNWLTGASQIPHDRFQFDLGRPNFGFVQDSKEAQPDCTCRRCIGFADQGRADFTVSLPLPSNGQNDGSVRYFRKREQKGGEHLYVPNSNSVWSS